MSKFPSSPKEYEQIVRDIYQELLKIEKIEAAVLHNVTDILGKSGTYPQLDIYWCFKSAGIEHRVVVDCKNYNKKVSIEDVRNLSAIIDDIGATKGVIVTTVGYQEGSEKFAKGYGIDLKLVRSPKDIDWSGYILAVTVNMKAIYREFINFDYTISISHDPYLKELSKKQKLNFRLVSTEIKLYQKDGSLHTLSFKDYLSQNVPIAVSKQIDKDTHSCELIPDGIYLQGSAENGEKILGKLVKLKVFYKNCIEENQFTVDAHDKIQAVLQDHNTGKIEHILPKK